VILACTILTQCSSVTDRETDRQTPRPRLRCAKHSAIASGKQIVCRVCHTGIYRCK